MFNNKEHEQLSEIYSQCIQAIKEYRKAHGTSLAETPLDELHRPFFDLYEQIAGVKSEFDAFEVRRRHYLARWNKYKHEAD
ncbi:MAG: hypothetical protein GY832_32985 [Chloroflexi bacterium]|nr:hypothetical protein [Chloroflexota bacterium]